MLSDTKIGHAKAVPVPLVPGPPRRHHITPRKLGHLGSNKLPVNKQLHLDTLPRISMIHSPTCDALLLDHRFAPAVKSWRERVDVHDHRNRRHQHGVENRFDD